MLTFQEMAARAAQQEDPQVTEIKRSFAPALAELRQLQREYQGKKSGWLGRLATVQEKWQIALSRRFPSGVNIVRPLEDLTGGRGLSPGLIHGTESLIESYIQKMETFSAHELPHRVVWISWPQAPQMVRDNFGGIEERLAFLENILKDGGEVYQWIQQQAGMVQR